MNWINSIRKVKVALVAAAVVIATLSLIVSHKLISDLQAEEISKMEVWAEAMRSLMSADETTDLNLVLKVINSNHSIPVIVTDGKDNVTITRNLQIEAPTTADSLAAVATALERMKEGGHTMKMLLTADNEAGIRAGDCINIYYTESLMLRRLGTYPYVQLGVVSLFIAVAVFALLSSKRAEQNKVWVGLSKETAHQLGTPISSIMAWVEVLKETYPEDELLKEMETDVLRLEMIAERFSKIGSAPELQAVALSGILENVMTYIGRRTSDKVKMHLTCDAGHDEALISPPLFEWVVEVLCKNAIDAMSGEGKIEIRCFREGGKMMVDVADSGKGISRKDHQTIFKPGYTTKKRGWGLGLSLAKRIVEEYHHGKIYVKNSAPNIGTTFRIELNAQC